MKYNNIGIDSSLDRKRIRKLLLIGLFAGVMVMIGDMLLGWGVGASGTSGLEANYVQFQPGNALKLEFPDESFDAVMSNYVYHNIPGKDRQAILLETLRVLKKGGCFAIHDIMSESKYGDMQSFVNKLKDMGYESVELIDTTDGKFMSLFEAKWMALSGSAILVGRK